jgi:serine/threonine-protein kinase
MRSTVSLSRALSLRAPIGSETERAQFQKRLALTLFIVFAMSFGFFLLQYGLVLTLSPEDITKMFHSKLTLIQLANTAAALAGSLYLRRGKPSARTLDVLDALSTVTICTVWALMIWEDDEAREPNIQLVALLATSYTLATRAALLPSTPGRSALLGFGAMAALVPIAYVLDDSVRPGQGIDAAIHMSTWAIVGIACTTTISHVIYGLRLQVRQAMQLGQYLLEEKIGEGGMGVVYRARHAMLRRPCAIKLLSQTTGHAADRFEREVQITAKLTHPNTVVVFDYGRTPDGAFYYAMEYLDGITLEDLVLQFGPQPPARVIHVLLQMCGALDEAHAHGLVHRDIKPANVMLTERGGVLDTVKVLDFGLVREPTQIDNGVSSVNSILGTPHFMAPEAILEPTAVDGRTDLYAVGATAYFLLTGEHVFSGQNLVEICSQHVHQAPVAPSQKRGGIPSMLDEAVLACLAKKPADRPTSAGALAERIRSCKVDEWTSIDARAFWDQPAAQRGARTKAAAKVGTKAELGDTVAVALEGRGVA